MVNDYIVALLDLIPLSLFRYSFQPLVVHLQIFLITDVFQLQFVYLSPWQLLGLLRGANCTAEALAMRLSKCNTLQSAIASELATDSEKNVTSTLQVCRIGHFVSGWLSREPSRGGNGTRFCARLVIHVCTRVMIPRGRALADQLCTEA